MSWKRNRSFVPFIGMKRPDRSRLPGVLYMRSPDIVGGAFGGKYVPFPSGSSIGTRSSHSCGEGREISGTKIRPPCSFSKLA